MKTFGWTRPVRDNSGTVIDSKPSPVRVRTLEQLGAGYGPDWDKRLIFTAHPADIIGLRPERTSRELLISAKDLYAHLIRLAANRTALEKARERKAAKSARLERLRIKRAEKRLYEKAEREAAESLRAQEAKP